MICIRIETLMFCFSFYSGPLFVALDFVYLMACVT